MKHLVWLALLLVSCTVLPTLPEPSDPIEVMNEATAVLVSRDKTGAIDSVCSAVWVSQVELITAAHCASMALTDEQAEAGVEPIGHSIEYLTRREAGGDLDKAHGAGNAIVVAVDTAKDLALLSAGTFLEHTIAQLERGPIRQGQDVWTMGHTFGLVYSLSGGMVSADRVVRHHGHVMHVLQIVSGANFGNSGGGVWTRDGLLLGIASYRYNDSDVCMFVHRDEVLAFLKREAALD